MRPAGRYMFYANGPKGCTRQLHTSKQSNYDRITLEDSRHKLRLATDSDEVCRLLFMLRGRQGRKLDSGACLHKGISTVHSWKTAAESRHIEKEDAREECSVMAGMYTPLH